MSKIAICLTALLLINFLSFGVALKCYICEGFKGFKGQLCNMNLRTNKTHIVAHDCSFQNAMCVKTIGPSKRKDKKLSISRSCVEKDTHFCKKHKKQFKRVRFCGTCTGNYCNSAPSARPNEKLFASVLFQIVIIPAVLFFMFK